MHSSCATGLMVPIDPVAAIRDELDEEQARNCNSYHKKFVCNLVLFFFGQGDAVHILRLGTTVSLESMLETLCSTRRYKYGIFECLEI